jgi:hypothetical protein
MTSALSLNVHHYTNTRHEPHTTCYWQPMLQQACVLEYGVGSTMKQQRRIVIDLHRIDVILLCSIPAGSRSDDRGHYLISTWPHSRCVVVFGRYCTLDRNSGTHGRALPIWIQGFRLIYDAMTLYFAKNCGKLLHSKHERPWFHLEKEGSLCTKRG